MSAMMRRRVTDDRRARAARTMAPRFIVEHGSLANSPDATRICSPASVKQQLQLVAAVVTAKGCIAAATWQLILHLSTKCKHVLQRCI